MTKNREIGPGTPKPQKQENRTHPPKSEKRAKTAKNRPKQAKTGKPGAQEREKIRGCGFRGRKQDQEIPGNRPKTGKLGKSEQTGTPKTAQKQEIPGGIMGGKQAEGVYGGQKQAKNREIHEKDGGPPGNTKNDEIRAPLERQNREFKKTRYFGTNFQEKREKGPKTIKNREIGPKTPKTGKNDQNGTIRGVKTGGRSQVLSETGEKGRPKTGKKRPKRGQSGGSKQGVGARS